MDAGRSGEQVGVNNERSADSDSDSAEVPYRRSSAYRIWGMVGASVGVAALVVILVSVTSSGHDSHAAASSVLLERDGSGDGRPPEGVYDWAQKFVNLSAKTLTIDGIAQVRISRSGPIHLVKAVIGSAASFDTGHSDNPDGSPFQVQSIGPHATIEVWVKLQADCSKVSRTSGPLGTPVVVSFNLVGYSGSATFEVGLSPALANNESLAQQICFGIT